MKRLYVAAWMLILASVGWAGETYLGTIRVYDGGTSNNCETTMLDAGRRSDGGLLTPDGGPTDRLYANIPFAIPGYPSGAPITMVCDNDVVSLPNRRYCDAGECPPWYTAQWLPTSTTSISFTYPALLGYQLTDGGLASETRTCSGGVVSIAPLSGLSATCKIFSRLGNE